MLSVNRAEIIGRLGKDPEIRAVQSGDKCANLTVATSEKWKDKQTGEDMEATEWHRVTVWQQGLVGVIERHLKKGSLVRFAGKMKTRKWTDTQGVDRYTTEIVLQGPGSEMTLLPQGSGGGGVPPAQSPDDYGAQKNTGASEADSSAGNMDGFDDDIPF